MTDKPLQQESNGKNDQLKESLNLLDLQIRTHERYDKSQSALNRFTGWVTSKKQESDQSLFGLKGLKERAAQELQAGNSQGTNKEITEKIKQDRELLGKRDSVTNLGSSFIKSFSLFLPGRVGIATSFATYALDQINPTGSVTELTLDGSVGGAKALLLRGTFRGIDKLGGGPAAKGIALGLSSRVIESGLARHSLIDSSTGNLTPAAAIRNASLAAINPTALAFDAAAFAGGHKLVSWAGKAGGGTLQRSGLFSSATAGGLFGLSNGFSGELFRQINSGESIDLQKAGNAALTHGALDALAGGAAHATGVGFAYGLDRANLALGRGIPVQRYLDRFHSNQGQSPTLLRLVVDNSNTRVQPDQIHTSVDHKRNLVYLRKGADGSELGHELKHRALRKADEEAFQQAAKSLQTGDRETAMKTYMSTRLAQEHAARKTELDVARELKDDSRAAAIITDPARILSEKTPAGVTYQQHWLGEFQQFEKSGGKFRPEFDYSTPVGKMVLQVEIQALPDASIPEGIIFKDKLMDNGASDVSVINREKLWVQIPLGSTDALRSVLTQVSDHGWRVDLHSPYSNLDLSVLRDAQAAAHITSLRVNNFARPEMELSTIVNDMPNLKHLQISKWDITDADLAAIGTLRDLQHLSISASSINHDSLAHLSTLDKLEHVHLNGIIGHGNIESLNSFPSLRRLILEDHYLTGEGLVLLNPSTIEKLEKLGLLCPRIGNYDLHQLNAAHNLRHLDLSNSNVQDDGLAHLQHLTTLQRLDLRNTHIYRDDLIHLIPLKELQHLDLTGSSVTNSGVRHLRNLKQLLKLDLRYCDIGDAGLAYLGELRKLQHLNLGLSRPIYTSPIPAEQANLPRYQITDAGLKQLKRVSTLSYLNLANRSITDAGLTHISDLPNLWEINVTGCNVTDAGLAHLWHSLPGRSIVSNEEPKPTGVDTH